MDGSTQETERVVGALLARYGWSLLARPELTARTVALVCAGSTPTQAAFAVYTPLLYQACSGAEGAARQEQAFTEVWRYLQQAVWRLAPDLPLVDREELVSEALATLYARICEPNRADRLRVPGALFAAAVQQLRNTLRSWRRVGSQTWQLAYEPSVPDHGVAAEDAEFAAQVRRCFVSCLQRYPRARLQLAAVWLRHMHGLDTAETMALLNTSYAQTRSLYSRGLRRLREDPAWQALAAQLGLGNAHNEGAAL